MEVGRKLTIGVKFEINVREMKARETVSVDSFISQVLWWYVNGIQLAKVELLIDRTSS